MSVNLKPTYDVGYEGYAVTGEPFTVIKYEGRKNITIQFECGTTKNTTSTHIKYGKVKYTFRTNYQVGQIVTNRAGVKAEILEIDKKRKRMKLSFQNGNIKNYSINSVSSKDFTDQNVVKIKSGDKFMTNNFGEVTVTQYHSAHKIDVVFEDGVTTTAQASSLRLGNVGHPMSGLHIGYKGVNADGCSFEVVDYQDPFNVSLKWYDGVITKNHTANNVRNNSIYYPNFKSTVGVGYFGVGKYKPNRSGSGSNYKQRVYDSWQRMIRRCYDEKEQKKPSCRAYAGVKVCEEWHNFQNFATWAEDKLDKFEAGWELDKDMFGTGLLYCPEYCTMLPSKINWFLCDTYSSKRSELPDGVTVIHPNPKYKNAKTGYVARCHINGKRQYLGYYDTPELAGKVYRKAKEGEAVRLAEEYKDILTEEQYLKLINFKLEDIHRKTKGATK